MTAKDCVLIANAIRTQVQALREDGAGSLFIAAIEGVAERIAVALAQDNPRFDRKRFMEACGFIG